MKLFPFVFGRSGGGAINSLGALKSETVWSETQQLLAYETQLKQIKGQLNQLLYNKIRDTSESTAQNRLLTLKRSIYNDRNIQELWQNIEGDIHADPELKRLVTSYLNAISQQKEAYSQFETTYQLALYSSVDRLEDIVSARYFQNGLLMASDSLYERAVAKRKLNLSVKKDRNLAFTLLKYLTRSVAKTTPFSTFNAIFCLEKQGTASVPVLTSRPSHFSVNSLLFHYVKKALLAYPDVRAILPVSLNPTVKEIESHFHYFINQDNNDAFRKISHQPLCAYLVQLLQAGAMSYQALTDHLSSVTHEPLNKVAGYLEQLLDSGFILITFPVTTDNANWPTQISELLQRSVPGTISDKVIAFLQTLTRTKDLLEEHYGVSHRRKLLRSVHRQLHQLHTFFQQHSISPQEDILPPTASDLFYEDSTTADCPPLDIDYFREDLLLLNRVLRPSNISQYVRTVCKEQLTATFGVARVPLLHFLARVYYPQRKRIMSEATQRMVQEAVSGFNLSDLLQNVHQLSDNTIDLKKYQNSTLPEGDNAFGVFCQVVSGESPLCIINSLTSGYGKSFSRFLNAFPQATRPLQEILERRCNSKEIVEIKDASLHNTNLYPALGSARVAIPGVCSVGGLPGIPLADLFLQTDHQDELLIEDRTGQPVIPIDCAMEGIHRRSALAQFLDWFSPTVSPTINETKIIEDFYVKRSTDSQADVVAVPRITFGQHLVLSRRKWIVKRNHLIKFLNGKSKFVALQQWRQRHQIPLEVYIRITQSSARTTDHYKPQYINFKIPLLVEYFICLLNKADSIITFTEMLPRTEDLPTETDGRRYVREYILNFV